MKYLAILLPLALAACSDPKGVGFTPYATTYEAPQPVSMAVGAPVQPLKMTDLSDAERRALRSGNVVGSRELGLPTYSAFSKSFRKEDLPVSFSSAAAIAPDLGKPAAVRSARPLNVAGKSYTIRRANYDGYRFAVISELGRPSGSFRYDTVLLDPAVAELTGCKPTGRFGHTSAEYGAPGVYAMELRC